LAGAIFAFARDHHLALKLGKGTEHAGLWASNQTQAPVRKIALWLPAMSN
jgi:hypothetical protein